MTKDIIDLQSGDRLLNGKLETVNEFIQKFEVMLENLRRQKLLEKARSIANKNTFFGSLRILNYAAMVSLAILPNNLIACGSYGEIIIWNPNSGYVKSLTTHYNLLDKRDQFIHALIVLENGRLVSGGYDGKISFWNGYNYHHIASIHPHANSVVSFAAYKTDLLASSSNDGQILINDISDGLYLHNYLNMHLSNDIAFSMVFYDSNLIIGGKYKIYILSVHLKQIVNVFYGHSSEVIFLLLMPSNKLASTSRDDTIRIWNLKNSSLILTLKGHTNTVCSLCLLNDNTILASASADHSIKLWDIETGEMMRTLNSHSDTVHSLVTLNDGRFVSASSDRSIKIWA